MAYDPNEQLKSIIAADVEKFSGNDFYISFVNAYDVSQVEKVLKTTFTNRGGLVNIAASKPYAFETCDLCLDDIVIKAKSKSHLNFFPIFGKKQFEKFFVIDELAYDNTYEPLGIVVVSHTFKWIKFFTGVLLNDNAACYVICNLVSKINSYVPNYMHTKYRPLFNGRLAVEGIYTNIEQYFAWKVYEKKLMLHGNAERAKERIAKRQQEINRLENEILELQKHIDDESLEANKVELDIHKAKVEFDMQFDTFV